MKGEQNHFSTGRSRIGFSTLGNGMAPLDRQSLLAGSPAIAKEFAGHDSTEMNRVYTHIEVKSMKNAAKLLPDCQKQSKITVSL